MKMNSYKPRFSMSDPGPVPHCWMMKGMTSSLFHHAADANCWVKTPT